MRIFIDYTKRQWLIVTLLNMANFCLAMCTSIQAPFYPQEAENKGATATQYGLVFGIYELTIFITSPYFGKRISTIGPKYLVCGGTLLAAVSVYSFGYLNRLENYYAFISLCFVLRVLEALGGAAFITTMFAIVAKEFPDNVAAIAGTLETFYGLGLVLGPSFGGFLYQLNGYTTPFAVLGGILFVITVMTIFLLPEDKELGSCPGYSLLKVLEIPDVALAACTITLASCSMGFLSATLEPHLRQFHLPSSKLGLMVAINGASYALTSPIFGWVCDKKFAQPKTITLLGIVFIIIGFSLIGPAPYIHEPTMLNATIIGLVVHGIGLGACVIAAFTDANRSAIQRGFSDNLETHGLIASMWTSSFALGFCIGPSVAGVLYDAVGFKQATLFIVTLSSFIALLVILFIGCSRRRSTYDQVFGLEDATDAHESLKRTGEI